MATVQTAQSARSLRTRRQATGRTVDARRRSRLSPVEIVTLVVIAGLLIVGAVKAQPHGTPAVQTTQTVQVQTGQNLWAIAQAHPIDGLTTSQTAEVISRSNNLSGSMLIAGQTLHVPAGDSAGPQMASR
jgi:Tfp pilus assembly protein FimV